jgi:hypothetical protein
MRSYNLFRRKRQSLICAVPEDCAVPAFLDGRRWEFGGTLHEGHPPLGFDPKAAAAGVRYNGFYLFERFDKH